MMKINRIFHIIVCGFILIFIRVWYLAVITYEDRLEQSKKPRERVVLDKVHRATIRDRFGIPLAINKIQYNACVVYAHLRQIPVSSFQLNREGKKVKIFPRAAYIERLSKKLASELQLESSYIKDLILAEAALLPHTPLLIQEDISETQYYRLKALEREWIGIQAEQSSRRYYPLGKVGCHVVGYLGPIEGMQYTKIAHQLRVLEEYQRAKEGGENPFLPKGFSSLEEVESKIIELREKAYSIHDLIGKSGIESSYEEELRGRHGKHLEERDIRGNCLSKTELVVPRSGQGVVLTISAELQDFTEKLLASSEGPKGYSDFSIDETWMRGGAIVAMIPKSGEVVALASYPRFDPNDFIPTRDYMIKISRGMAVKKWLETKTYIGEIWDGKRDIEREYYSFIRGKYVEEKVPLTFKRYLHAVVSPKSTVADIIQGIELQLAVELQQVGIFHPVLDKVPFEEDRLLILDLAHLMAPKERFTDELLKHLPSVSLEEYFEDRREALQVLERIKDRIESLFHRTSFLDWRRVHFKSFLAQKREQEKRNRLYSKPYTEYLSEAEKALFTAFWKVYRFLFLHTIFTGKVSIQLQDYPYLAPYFAELADFSRTLEPSFSIGQKLSRLSPNTGIAYLNTFRSFEELNLPLKGKYTRFSGKVPLEGDLAAAFYPLYGYGFSRSCAFQQTSPQGSIFKVITAYQAIKERYELGLSLNPLTVTDDTKRSRNSQTEIAGYHLNGNPIPRIYKGGKLPRSSHSGIGTVDLIKAMEQSSNLYFALLAGEVIASPANLVQAARQFGYGGKTGLDIPYEVTGTFPLDLEGNKTALYAFSIGQHTLEVTPIQTAVMLSTLSNQGEHQAQKVLPHLLLYPESEKKRLAQRRGLFSFPFPDPVFSLIAKGMHQTVGGGRGTARPGIVRNSHDHPFAYRDYLKNVPSLIAKTGTAQFKYKGNLSKESDAVMRCNAWFGAVAYPLDRPLDAFDPKEPELVVVIFLRFREWGNEGATMATQVIEKWREIKQKYGVITQ